MSKSQFVVTSEVHGDFAGYPTAIWAASVAAELNSRLWDTVVYFPLIAVEFVVTPAEEAALIRQYNAQAYSVASVEEF